MGVSLLGHSIREVATIDKNPTKLSRQYIVHNFLDNMRVHIYSLMANGPNNDRKEASYGVESPVPPLRTDD